MAAVTRVAIRRLPSRSSRGRSARRTATRGASGGRKAATAPRISRPIPEIAQNAIRQLDWPMKVPKGTPTTDAMEMPLKTTAVARTACSFGTRRMAMLAAIDHITPWAKPVSSRESISTANEDDSAVKAFPATKIARTSSSSSRRSIRRVATVSTGAKRPATAP